MVSLKFHRRVAIAARIGSGVVSSVSLVLFTIIIVKVFDSRFPSLIPGYSALPVGALSLGILWNIIALITIGRLGRFFHPIGDSIIVVVLAVLGAVGFTHDDNAYLSNGMYLSYDNDDWLIQAIWAGSLMIAALLIQTFLVIWVFIRPRTRAQNDCWVSHPPAYIDNDYVPEVKEVKNKEFEVDWQSVSSLEMPPSVVKKDVEKV